MATLPGATIPDESGALVLQAAIKEYPTTRGILIITHDTVYALTDMPVENLLGAIAEYVYDVAQEMGME